MRPEIIPISISQHFETALLRKIETVLAQSGLIICPTESSYLLGANAWDDTAVSTIYQLKQRDPGKPLPVVVKDISAARQVVQFNDLADRIGAEFWPGPLTVILPARRGRGLKFQAGQRTIGLRVSRFPVLQQLFRRLTFPLISTSANLAGQPEPYSPLALINSGRQAGQQIRLILDAGLLPPNPPSTIIDLSQASPVLVREGALPFTELTALIASQ